jgi:3-oxoacyl-[acyl-carrier-protein] synthase-1
MQSSDIFVVSDNIFAPLGTTSAGNFAQLKKGLSGVRQHDRPTLSERPFYAALFEPLGTEGPVDPYTLFEQLLIASISDALRTGGIGPDDKKTILIISTTKGNISLLEEGIDDSDRLALHRSARLVADHFGFVNTPLIVSNACISGVLALLTGMRLIRSGQFENAVVAGADIVSRFVLSGFGAFQAISPGPCKPFDEARDGINLGEGAGTIILSSRSDYRRGIRIRSGSVSNDANHISAPSRTGEELCQVITRSLLGARLRPRDIGFISAHGTATVYNDEMEAKAITLADLPAVPVNSLKGYYGHTLGAAGLIESIVTLESMRENVVLPSRGFQRNGVTQPLNICTELSYMPLDHCLKTASGFGGCNAAVIFSKQ